MVLDHYLALTALLQNISHELEVCAPKRGQQLKYGLCPVNQRKPQWLDCGTVGCPVFLDPTPLISRRSTEKKLIKCLTLWPPNFKIRATCTILILLCIKLPQKRCKLHPETYSGLRAALVSGPWRWGEASGRPRWVSEKWIWKDNL